MPMLQKLLNFARPALIQLGNELQKLAPSAKQPRLAILIDAENVSATKADFMLKQIRSWGQPVIMRAYADWTNSSVSSWKDICRLHPIQAIQQHNYVKGKSTTDMALIIDAMDLLHGEIPLDGFCIISGDSDFTPLALRLRHEGKLVYGIGHQRAIAGLQGTCHQFVNLAELTSTPVQATPAPKPSKSKPSEITPLKQKRIINQDLSQDRALHATIHDMFSKQLKQQQEWVDMAKMDLELKGHQYYQSCRAKFKNLSTMYSALSYLELGHRPEKISQYFVRYLPPTDTAQIGSPITLSSDTQRQVMFDRISALALVHADEQFRISTKALLDAWLILNPSFDSRQHGYDSWEGLLADHPDLSLGIGPTSRTKTMLAISSGQQSDQSKLTDADAMVRYAVQSFQRPDRWSSAVDVLRYLQHPLIDHHWPEGDAQAWELFATLPYLVTASDCNRRELLVGFSEDPLRDSPRLLQPNCSPDLSLSGLSEIMAIFVAFNGDNDGWINLAEILVVLQRRYQLFSARHYGHNGLRKLIEADGQFETLSRNAEIWVRLRSQKQMGATLTVSPVMQAA